MRWTLFMIVTVGVAAHADTSAPRAIAGGEHPGFRKWVQAWAGARHGRIADWWSGDFDGDGKADDVAVVCLEPAEPMAIAGAFLVEDANRRRSAVGFRPTWRLLVRQGCEAPEALPAFKRTDDLEISGKAAAGGRDASTNGPLNFIRVRGEEQETESEEFILGLRDGRLVVTSHSYQYGGTERPHTRDWDRLVELTGDGGRDSREQAILLVTRTGNFQPTLNTVVRGRTSWRGPSDAGFRVGVGMHGATSIVVHIAIDDDAPVLASDATPEALAASDHLEVRIGARTLRLGRTPGEDWFGLPGAGMTQAALALVRVTGKGARVDIVAPAAWAGKLTDAGGEGSLVVMFADVDEPHSAVRTVVATAPVPQKREPTGILLRLPDGDRWEAPQRGHEGALESLPIE